MLSRYRRTRLVRRTQGAGTYLTIMLVVPRRIRIFRVSLYDASADDVVATLEDLGAVRPEAGGPWMYPSAEEPGVHVSPIVGNDEDAVRLELGSIHTH